MVTMQDIADKAGVSKMTVSNVLRGRGHFSEETSELVLATARALHYRISAKSVAAGSLRRQSEDDARGAIGIAVSTLRTPWVAELSSYIAEEARKHRLTAAVEETNTRQEDEKSAIARLTNHFYDGLIFTHSNLPPEIIDTLSLHRPTVLVDYTHPRRAIDTVTTDSMHAGRLAVDYLAAKSHRRLLIMGASPDPKRNSLDINYVRAYRLKGCLGAMDDHRLEYDERSFVGVKWDADICRSAVVELGRAAIRRFDAVVCLNDSAAIGTIRGLKDLGLDVPGDIAVMGMSGLELGTYLTPSLTTVDLDTRGIARAAVALLTERIENDADPEPRTINVPCHVREGESA